MIEITDVYSNTDAAIGFVIQGDGTTTELKAALNKDPFNMSFNNLPSGLTLDLGDPDLGTATASLALVGSDYILTVNFSIAPPLDSTMGINIAPFWDSL
jgi:hypothetical protein